MENLTKGLFVMLELIMQVLGYMADVISVATWIKSLFKKDDK